MFLPPTEEHILFHIMHANLQTILAKSADQQIPPELDIAQFRWEIKDGIPVSITYDQTSASALCQAVIGGAKLHWS